jgi:23S rRNA (pseudouridine1915-N3)-methyltransferase
MLLHIIARGKIGRSPEAELVERYAKRIAWGLWRWMNGASS